MKTILSASVFLLAGTLGLDHPFAQTDAPPPRPGAAAPAAAAPTEATPAAAAPAETGTEDRLQTLERELSALKEQNQALASQLSEVQEVQNQNVGEVPSDLGKTKIFGFFDMSFYKLLYEKDTSVLKTTIPASDKSSFMISSLNVYLGNQITEQLKFLSELRFTYQPLGNETSIATYGVLPDGSQIPLGSTYARTNTSVDDPQSVQTYRLGGVSLERVQITYSFNDYLRVTAGRFLTPYGIWNVEHGSPVILMTRAPILQTQQMVPTAQTGLQLFGRVFLGDEVSLDYAGTVSNGRGPVDSMWDYDEDKGVGLRWRLNYDQGDFALALGQYGYTGKYTDITKAMYAGPGSGDIDVVLTTRNQYREYTLANDILVTFHGLRLQSEVVLKRVDYQIPPRLDSSNFNGFPTLAGNYNAADFLSQAFYVLLAYELPEALTGGKLRLTPFLYYEHFNLNDTVDSMSKANVYVAGLNIRPYQNLVFKLEYDLVDFSDLVSYQMDGSSAMQNPGRLQGLTGQLAVTF